MATLKQRLHRKNGSSYDTIHLETDATVVKMSTTDDTTLSTKIKNIDTEMNSVKTSVSNGKSLIASAITDKGVSTASDATFQVMADNIASLEIKAPSTAPVKNTDFTYTGNCEVIDDQDSNWRIKFLTSGTLVWLTTPVAIDAFLVGGGGGGTCRGSATNSWPWLDGAGGGGGYTKTITDLQPIVNYNYPIVIGNGGACGYISTNGKTTGSAGGQTSFMDNNASGGGGAYNYNHGGNGGSGGGSSSSNYNYSEIHGNGGSNGSGGTGQYTSTGQGSTTREFSESSGNLYSGGGAGTYGTGGNGGGGSSNTSGTMNTGGGSGSSFNTTNTGGSGIVVIRNAR